MPVDLIQFFSRPSFALHMSLIVVSYIAYCVYRFADVKRSNTDYVLAYWKIATMVAEICVVVGLIGLATFAGREKIKFDKAKLEKKVEISERKLVEQISYLQINYCKEQLESATPLASLATGYALCRIIFSIKGHATDNQPWEDVAAKLKIFSDTHKNSKWHHELAVKINDLISQYIEAKHTFLTFKEQEKFHAQDAPWRLLFVAFLMLAFGVSIKIAKATYEAQGALKNFPVFSSLASFSGWVFVGFFLSSLWLGFGWLLTGVAVAIAVFLTGIWRKKFFNSKFSNLDYLVILMAYSIGTLLGRFI